MKCVILQPAYIPWRGYFDQISRADVFVFYDDVQYDRRGWRNRNKIKTAQGTRWLTIPVHSRGVQIDHTPINEINIAWEKPWNKDHLRSIQSAYGHAPYFKRYFGLLEEIYAGKPNLLADFTIDLTIALSHELGLHHTQFMRSSSIKAEGAKTDRLLSILKELRADHYISGPAARDYIETEKFSQAGIRLEYMDYDYPEYPQLYPPYDPQVSIIDLLFMTGPDAIRNIQGEPVP